MKNEESGLPRRIVYSSMVGTHSRERPLFLSAVNIPVSVLSSKKDTVENKNRKDYATDKWEQEIRDTVAKRKGSAIGANLSKAQKAAVSAQLAREAETRKAITATRGRLQEGVELIASLIASNTEAMRRYVGEMASLLLSMVYGSGSFLMDQRAFDVFLVSCMDLSFGKRLIDEQQLGSLASDRLGEYRRLLPAAILRADKASLVPDDYQHESLAGQFPFQLRSNESQS